MISADNNFIEVSSWNCFLTEDQTGISRLVQQLLDSVFDFSGVTLSKCTQDSELQAEEFLRNANFVIGELLPRAATSPGGQDLQGLVTVINFNSWYGSLPPG